MITNFSLKKVFFKILVVTHSKIWWSFLKLKFWIFLFFYLLLCEWKIYFLIHCILFTCTMFAFPVMTVSSPTFLSKSTKEAHLMFSTSSELISSSNIGLSKVSIEFRTFWIFLDFFAPKAWRALQTEGAFGTNAEEPEPEFSCSVSIFLFTSSMSISPSPSYEIDNYKSLFNLTRNLYPRMKNVFVT